VGKRRLLTVPWLLRADHPHGRGEKHNVKFHL